MNRTPDDTLNAGPALEPGQGEGDLRSEDRFEHIGFKGWKKTAPSPVPRTVAPRSAKLLAKAIEQAPPLDSPDLSFVRRIVASAGLQPEAYRMAPLLRRIPACLRVLRTDSMKDADALLTRHPELFPRALNALLIGTTEFFRDKIVFDVLRDSVVPDLVARKRYPRVWSVACSDGAELHSVAMVFALFGDLAAGQFLGTDCRPAAVEKARGGNYPPLALAGIGEPFQSLFMIHGRNGPTISPSLRRAIGWSTGDVLADEATGDWDMILCRNLAIYLDPATTESLWRKLSSALAPGGFLIVGKAEKPRLPCLRKVAPSIYQKSGSSTASE